MTVLCFILIWCVLLWRAHYCQNVGPITVKDLSDDGQLYLPSANSTLAFTFSVTGRCRFVMVELDGFTLCQYTPTMDNDTLQSADSMCSYSVTTGAFTVANVSTEERRQTATIRAHSCSGNTADVVLYIFDITVIEPPRLISFTVHTQRPQPVDQGQENHALVVDENSRVVLECRWAPGHPPRRASITRNGILLPPSRLVTLPPPREEVVEGEGELGREREEAVNLVEHTIHRLGSQHSGLYACQVETGGGRRDVLLLTRAKQDKSSVPVVIVVSASVASTLFVSCVITSVCVCCLRNKRKHGVEQVELPAVVASHSSVFPLSGTAPRPHPTSSAQTAPSLQDTAPYEEVDDDMRVVVGPPHTPQSSDSSPYYELNATDIGLDPAYTAVSQAAQNSGAEECGYEESLLPSCSATSVTDEV
ncbi:uncharacterized protein LOC143277606 [Babylonia areolata]|uniref:uncharacterized protein LOC143277606 n=1 Tax=Babylonia areolata TaxID=304850 RepID=UPI003FD309FB